MQRKMPYKSFIFSIATFLALWGMPQHLFAQINQALVVVNFNQPPTSFYVYKAPLKYNKTFALSMQIDDGTDDIFTHAYPVFEGGTVDGTTYPGITYSDGCGNLIHFKMSSSVYSFNGSGNNGPDVHLPGNGYGKVSWPQMDTMYKNHWGILNHGVNGNGSVDPDFMDYSIKRDQSYIRRKLYETTDGGVITHLHVNPDGHFQWTQPAFDLGYRGTLNQNHPSPLSEHGGNVNDPGVSWTQPQNLYRVIAEDINVPAFVQALADSSTGNKRFWGAMFTHSVVTQYSFPTFVSDFTSIGNFYGSNGLDNIWMATDEEILDYLLVRDTVGINYVLAGSSMFITFTGAVPHNLEYYALSLGVETNATIQSITVTGIDSVTYTGVGSGNALINLNWDEYVVTPPEVLADSFTTIATTTSAQFDCWVAMDYVITLEDGEHKDSLRHVLCDIPNTTYDEGFCDFLNVDLGPDTTICAGECVTLSGPPDMASYEWIVADTTYDTVQTIVVCPIDTTQYILNVTDTTGNQDSDTIVINVLPSANVQLGNDTTLCLGDSLVLSAPAPPAGETYSYLWNTGDTTQSITVFPNVIDSTFVYYVDVSNDYGCTSSDTILVTVYERPDCVIQQDTVSVCEGTPADFFTLPADCNLYIWTYGNTVDTTEFGHLRINPADSSMTVYLEVQNNSGCSLFDSAFLEVYPGPELTVGNDTILCEGDTVTLFASGAESYLWMLFSDTIGTQSVVTTVPPAGVNPYVVFGKSEHNCVSSDTVTVTANPAPNTKIIYDTNVVCANSTVYLYATGADSYIWSPGNDTTTEYSYLLTDTTTFYLTGYSQTGCSSVDSVTINAKPAPEVSFSGLLPAYCANDPDVTLTGIPEEGTFAGAGITDNIFSPSTAGIGEHLILFTYTNAAGCMGIDSARTTVYGGGDDILLSPSDTTLFPGDSVILNAGPGFDHYYWSTGDTTQSVIIYYDDYPNGTYNVIVIGVINSCTSQGSAVVTFMKHNGIGQHQLPAMVVFPNPNHGNFSVVYDGSDSQPELTVRNNMGQIVFVKKELHCSPDCRFEVNIPHLKSGIYYVQLVTDNGTLTRRIVVQ